MANPQKPSLLAQWRTSLKQRWGNSWFAKSRLGKWLRALLGSKNGPAQSSPTTAPRPESTSADKPAFTSASVTPAAQNDRTGNKNLNHGTAPQASEAAPRPELPSTANSDSTPGSASPVAENFTTSHRNLNKDVALLLSNRLDLTDAINLAKSDGFFWRTTGPRVKERVREYAQTVIDHLVLGRFEAGEAMIKKTPKSLFWKAKAKDYAGHAIVGADGKGVHPYEVALLNGHVSLAQRLAALFSDAAETERLRQHTRQLPQGYFVQNETTYTVNYFKTKMQAAVAGDAEALAQFRDDFKPREIRAGTPMRHQALINALLAFEAKWADWTWPQRRAVGNTFICTILRNASAREAQEFARGLFFVNNGEDVPESFQFRDESGVFFPLPEGENGLGFDLDFDFYYGAGRGMRRPGASRAGWGSRRAALSNICRAKTQALGNLNEPEEHTLKSGCTLC